MGKGHMPPTGTTTMGLHGIPVYEECLNINETYCIQFDDAGLFTYFPMGLFSPDLPMGYFPQNDVEGTFTPLMPGQITIFFLDARTGLPYVEVLTISDECPPSDEPCT
jgi:hypothetical protein